MSSRIFEFSDLINIQSIIKASAQSSLLRFFAQSTASVKTDGSIVTEADIAMHETMSSALSQSYPEVDMLSEELTQQQQTVVLQSGRDYWCLDPVDGTNNFHSTLPLFAVSLALIREGEVILGIIYDPIREEFFSALRGQGVWVNNQPLKRPVQPQTIRDSIAFVDFKRLSLDIKLKLVQHTPYKCQRNIGTCALEWAWLAAGRVQLLIHGSEKLWDYAAGVLLASEAGAFSQTIEGEPVFIEKLIPRSVVAANNTALFDEWTRYISDAQNIRSE